MSYIPDMDIALMERIFGSNEENDMATGQANTQAPEQPKEIERLQHRLEGNNDMLNKAAERLEQLSDRIQGSIPREAELAKRGDSEPDIPTGGIHAVNYMIDRMSAASDRIYSALARLEEL